MSVNNTYW